MLILPDAGIEAHQADRNLEGRSRSDPAGAVTVLYNHPARRCIGQDRANCLGGGVGSPKSTGDQDRHYPVFMHFHFFDALENNKKCDTQLTVETIGCCLPAVAGLLQGGEKTRHMHDSPARVNRVQPFRRSHADPKMLVHRQTCDVHSCVFRRAVLSIASAMREYSAEGKS